MMKNRRIQLLMIVLFLWFSLTATISNAVYLVAVKNGDWMRYDINITYQGQTVKGSVKLNIQNVQGLLVSGTYEVNVEGYSVMPATQFTLDISTGSGGYASGYIIPANLTVGEPIPGEAATVQKIADSHGRKAIVANATAPFMGFEAQVHWDQATGVLLETSGSAAGTTYSISLAETSLWSGGLLGMDLTLWIAIIVIVIVAVAAVTLILRRKRAQAGPPLPQAGQPPPPPPPPPPP